MLLLLDPGLRLSEALELRVNDLDLQSGTATVVGKGQKERIVYLGRRAHEAMLTYRTFVRPH